MSVFKEMINRLGSRLRRRFGFFFWPAAVLGERAMVWKSENISKPADQNCRFPLRMMRYWFISCALRDEARRLGRPITVVDVGCGKGILRKFVGTGIPARWVGLDLKVERAKLAQAGYDELHACDFDKPLPVAAGAADVVVFLHVLEHVPRPTFTLSELSRILVPGGVLLAGSPVAPRWLSLAREWLFRRQLRQGKRISGQHISCFWPARWSEMVRAQGLTIELLSGAYLLRWAGNPLEDTQLWLRLNQLWGALFPALGGEVYLMARSSRTTPPHRPDAGF
jgi:SAM-dependent methyltransferase